ncbi:25633_t:CDS:2 [Racocetra persica]|uniref:25633_t:CDS:1 n=1 Tax=Racocetra persica TaxID=160502 RepID=A0ACA9LG42_9GLOM|nr:25633_t:CDS:2 [Racocetra persica]
MTSGALYIFFYLKCLFLVDPAPYGISIFLAKPSPYEVPIFLTELSPYGVPIFLVEPSPYRRMVLISLDKDISEEQLEEWLHYNLVQVFFHIRKYDFDTFGHLHFYTKIAAANFFYTMKNEEMKGGPFNCTITFEKANYFRTSLKTGYVIYRKPEQPIALSLVKTVKRLKEKFEELEASKRKKPFQNRE